MLEGDAGTADDTEVGVLGELDLTKELGGGWCVTVGLKLTEFARVTPIVKLAYSF